MGFFDFFAKRASDNIEEDRFCLKEGYAINRETEYYLDVADQFIYQPDVYELARYLAKRSQIETIIDIGSGNGIKLKPFSDDYQLICIDYGGNQEIIRKNLPSMHFVEANLEEGLPSLPPVALAKTLIIISDVVEHLVNPHKLLASLSSLSHQCPYILISTPDRVKCRGLGDFGPPANRCHVREWTADEFDLLLRRYDFAPFMLGHTINTSYHLQKNTILALTGTHLYQPATKPCRVLAVVNAYNEVDMIGEVVEHLLRQDVDVQVVDNWSNDGTYEAIQSLEAAYPGRVFSCRFPEQPGQYYEWERLLKHTVEVGAASGYDWIIHQDADEIRESPWKGVTLGAAIAFIDELGFNAIDFTVLDFRPVAPQSDRPGGMQNNLLFFEFGKRPGHFAQVKAWKNQSGVAVNLAASGGHIAEFADQKVYPIKFLLRHYPLRSPEQARKKIFADRKGRFLPAEKEGKGWHIQYDQFTPEDSFIWDRNSLICWNRNLLDNEYFVERISGIGVVRDKEG
ncbi:MAG: glycosyltransferase family 2 protein [Sporomusaceae bacterium]|nr:glycosyltransferase family 2 protein [Sporomusaceae bacterium]